MAEPARRIESTQGMFAAAQPEPEPPTMEFLRQTAADLIKESRVQKTRIAALEMENLLLQTSLEEQATLIGTVPSEVQKKIEGIVVRNLMLQANQPLQEAEENRLEQQIEVAVSRAMQQFHETVQKNFKKLNKEEIQRPEEDSMLRRALRLQKERSDQLVRIMRNTEERLADLHAQTKQIQTEKEVLKEELDAVKKKAFEDRNDLLAKNQRLREQIQSLENSLEVCSEEGDGVVQSIALSAVPSQNVGEEAKIDGVLGEVVDALARAPYTLSISDL